MGNILFALGVFIIFCLIAGAGLMGLTHWYLYLRQTYGGDRR